MVAVSQSNHRLYREVNKRILEVTGSADAALGFLCECGVADCTATIELTKEEADALMGEKGSILLAPEHAGALSARRVLAQGDRFLVVAPD